MENPGITVGGQSFPVPPLSIGQLRIVVPAIQRLKGMNLEAITEDNINDLTEITYLAILRGTPTFPRDKFMSMAGTTEDLLMAFPVIAQQCGMISRKAGDAGESQPNQPVK
jgi:hypothetical protein